MVEHEIDTLGGLLSATWELTTQVLRLNPKAYEAILAVPDGWRLAVSILIIAGLSYTLGQSVVLFANRVNRSHFIFSLAVSALTLAISVAFWAFSIWFLAETLFGARQSFGAVMIAVAISFAPYLFGFLILLPYLGNIIFYVLRIWVFLAVVVGGAVTFQLGFFEALVCSALGWTILELLTRIPILRIKSLDSWLWRVTTGTDHQLQTDEIVNLYVDEERSSAFGEGKE